jgi:hypothetical protein
VWYKSRIGRTDTDSLIFSRGGKSDSGDHPADERQITSKPITICGDHPAWYLETKRDRREVEEILESITTRWDGVAYKALYIRMSGEPRDAAAETSMRALCKKSP